MSVSGGTPPYTHLWSNGSTNEDISGLSPGFYSVVITDNNACTFNAGTTINVLSNIQLSSSTVDVSCFGGNDGSINLNVTGGVSPYSYSWSNGETTQDILSLIAGIYSVTVTDSLGCSDSLSVTIFEPTELDISLSGIQNVSCFGGTDGHINITTSGGTPPYVFNWSNGVSTENNPSIGAGSYSITVTDANGCAKADTFSIVEPSAITVSISSEPVICEGGSDGSISLSPSGGTPPYTYFWSTGATTSSINNLTAGNYLFTVTDNNNCTYTSNQTIGTLSSMIIQSNVSQISCNGADDGAIVITVTGGIEPYSYSWSSGETTKDLTDLGPGVYDLTVTDDSNCVISESFTINEPDVLSLTVQTINIDCNGSGNGSINLTVVGGTTPYSYLWSNGAVTEDLSGISGGLYTVTVTDNNGCQDSISAFINEPDTIGLQSAINPVSCNGGSDASIFLTVNGGTPPYIYLWSNNATTQDIVNVNAGSYHVTVTDNAGCIKSQSFIVSEPLELTTSISSTNVSCNEGNDGQVILTVNGGTQPYVFLWSNFETTQNLSTATAAFYTVVVTDNKGCTITDTVTITEPPALEVVAVVTDDDCGFNQGGVSLTVSGGTPGYTYLWSTGDTTKDLVNRGAGSYSVIITDQNLCVDSFTFNVTQPDSMVITATVIDVVCVGDSNGAINLNVLGGIQPYSYTWSNGATTKNISSLSGGTYIVTVIDASNCLKVDSFDVNEPDTLMSSIVQTPVTCFGSSDGIADLTVTGGTPPYTYLWSTFQFNQDLVNIPGGEYSVIITDANGCRIVDSVSVFEPEQMEITAIAKGAGCGNASGGIVDITVIGGVTPYSYLWSNGDTTQDLTNLMPGTYTVTVTDDHGCTISSQSTVTSFPIPNVSFNVNDVCGEAPAIFENTSSIVNVGLTYLWKFGDGDTSSAEHPIHYYADTGSYLVTLVATSDNDCVDSAQHVISVFPSSDATIQSIGTAFCATDTLELTASEENALYSWSTGDSVRTINVNSEGIYSVTVANQYGCIDSSTIYIAAYDSLIVEVSNDTTINRGFSVQLHASGGDFYLWTPNAGLDDPQSATPVARPLQSTVYNVLVTDENGCVADADITIEVLDEIVLDVPNLFTPNGDGHNDTWRVTNIDLYPECEVSVFNRWGSEVYSTKNYQNDWDGTNGGSALADGTYYYVINCEGASVVYKGAITILR